MRFSMESSQPRDRTRMSCVTGELFTIEPLGKPKESYSHYWGCSVDGLVAESCLILAIPRAVAHQAPQFLYLLSKPHSSV